ncbi:MAG: hypothetical protein VXY50_02760 [Verrucomicrobiota bacterium]|nr:hypothetical protein [Verrucomicrobiota bacterium]
MIDGLLIKTKFRRTSIAFLLTFLPTLLILLTGSCSYSSSRGWSFSDSESVSEQKERDRLVGRKTTRILEVGRIKEPVKARKEARREVAEEEFFRSFRP